MKGPRTTVLLVVTSLPHLLKVYSKQYRSRRRVWFLVATYQRTHVAPNFVPNTYATDSTGHRAPATGRLWMIKGWASVCSCLFTVAHLFCRTECVI